MRVTGASAVRALAGCATVAAATPALAHTADAAAARDVTWLSWTAEPWVLILLAASAALYAAGVARLWKQAGAGRGVSLRRALAFAAGWLALVLALASPLDALGARLFTAHMVQHEVLMIVAAPLVVVGRPLAAWAWALPFEWRRGVGRFFRARAWRGPWLWITAPLAAWALHALALWLWHIPSWFDFALANEAMHATQHAAFLFTALLFWWSVLGTTSAQDEGIALLSLFTTMVHTGALGALLTLSPVPWYAAYAATAPALGLDALEDQQIGGLVMWVPAGLVYLGCGMVLAARWIRGQRPARASLPVTEGIR
jgi:putative membrane protein